MAVRFRRTVKIAPGVRLNFGKKGASVRVGGRGFGVTTGTSGARVSAGIPGTGLYATQKIAGARSHASSQSASPTVQPSTVSVRQAAAALGPKEAGLDYPSWWLAGAILFVLGAFGGAYAAILLAIPCGYMVWRRLNSPKYVAAKQIKTAESTPSEESDSIVTNAASQAEDSWTVQRAAGLYFSERERPDVAVGYLAKALDMFPGDKRPLLILAAGMATDAGQLDYAVSLLEPWLSSAAPDDSPLDAVIVSMLAAAFQKKGDASRALEIVGRLPLRRRNLDQPLLMGLCIRALAKHALGKKADARRDLDRVYAVDPGFAYLNEAEEAISAGEAV